MPLLTLYGHAALRERLRNAFARGTLPSSLLLQGPRGVGKQQIALWLARTLLCEHPDRAPCEACQSCRMSREAQHPDMQWVFARPRLKGDFDVDDVRQDMADAIAERMQNGGLYEATGGDESIFITTTHALVQKAVLSPAMGHRKVLIVGDADRMVAQEGSDQAANAFLKLLEEPPENTNVILTSSEPGALLPTIRSRVVTLRVSPVSDQDVAAFLADPVVANRLDTGGATTAELTELAGGSPGRLVDRHAWQAALAQARRLLDAAGAPDPGARMRVALGQGGTGARGRFSDTLDALTVLLHERTRAAVRSGNESQASGAARAMAAVEEAKELAQGNVNPQLLAAGLLRQMASAAQ